VVRPDAEAEEADHDARSCPHMVRKERGAFFYAVVGTICTSVIM
jgi:hypothetical protein